MTEFKISDCTPNESIKWVDLSDDCEKAELKGWLIAWAKFMIYIDDQNVDQNQRGEEYRGQQININIG